MKSIVLLFSCFSLNLSTYGQSSPATQSLPYSQNFSTHVASSAVYPAGWQGWTLAASDSLVFSTTGPSANSALIGSSTAAITTGGVHNYNQKIGILPSVSVNPGLCLALNTTGNSNVQVNFDVMTIRNPFNGSTQTRISGIDLQYQVGSIAGAWISVSGLTDGVYQNNTTTQTTAITTPQNSQPKSLTLPAVCNNQSIVYIRWVARIISGSGTDRPSFAVDNLVICTITTPTISISGPGAFCSGQTATYTAVITNGGTAPTYQWKKNGTNAGTGSSVTLNGLVVNDSIICVLTSNLGCATPTTATSNTIKIGSVVTPPTISSAVITNASCPNGRDGTINITVTGGTMPYTICWDTINTMNGVMFGVTTAVKTSSGPLFGRGTSAFGFFIDGIESKELFLTNGIAYSFIVMNTIGHPFHISTDSIGGNSSNLVTNGQFPVPTAIQNGTYTFKPNSSLPSQLYYPCAVHTYMGWRIHPQNGLCVEDPSNLHAGIYTVIVRDANGCTTSAQYTVSESPAIASVSIAAIPAGSICSGTSVIFTATPTNGGTAPSYQWKKNGANVGTNSTAYSDNTLHNADSIRCVMTSNSACVPIAQVTSTKITMTVNPSVTASVSIGAVPSGAICSGTEVTFRASPTNGGTTPSYQWKKNGTTVGTNSAIYADNALNNGDSIRCVMTSNAVCVLGSPASSTTITMTVNPNVTPSVSIAANPAGTICSGTNVTFTATPTNGGTAPTYQWKKNETDVGINSTMYSDSTLNDGDSIRCVMKSNAPCVSGNPASSTPVIISVTVCQEVILNLKVFIEGFYQGNDSMQPILYNNEASTDSTACDSIAIELHDATEPDTLVAVAKALLHTNGMAEVLFPDLPMNSSYYVVVRHRNGLETWSKDPLLFDSASMSFDFTRP